MKFMIIDFYRNTKLSKFIGCTKLLFKLFFLFFIPIYKKIVVYIKIKVFSMINERCKSFFYLIFAFLSYLYNIRYSLFIFFQGIKRLDLGMYFIFKAFTKCHLFIFEQIIDLGRSCLESFFIR